MAVIMRLDKKQAAILEAVQALEGDVNGVLRSVLELEQVLPEIGGLHRLAEAAAVLVIIGEKTGADAFELSSVLSMIRASAFGDVLSPDRIPVQVDDEHRGFGNMSDEEGFLLRQGRNLSIYVIGRGETYMLVSEAGCKLWSTSPEALAECIGEVFLSIGEDGTIDTRIYAGELALDACEDIAEFKAAG